MGGVRELSQLVSEHLLVLELALGKHGDLVAEGSQHLRPDEVVPLLGGAVVVLPNHLEEEVAPLVLLPVEGLQQVHRGVHLVEQTSLEYSGQDVHRI